MEPALSTLRAGGNSPLTVRLTTSGQLRRYNMKQAIKENKTNKGKANIIDLEKAKVLSMDLGIMLFHWKTKHRINMLEMGMIMDTTMTCMKEAYSKKIDGADDNE
jgi:hypothetical protein